MKKFKRTFIQKVQDFIFRLALSFFPKWFQGKNVIFKRIYPKITRVEKGWIVSDSPQRNAFLIKNDEEEYWCPIKNMFYDPINKRKTIVFRDYDLNLPLFEIVEDKIFVSVLEEEQSTNQMLKSIEKNASKLLKRKK
jgi:hypothetical protein